jgi:hypothetical protein
VRRVIAIAIGAALIAGTAGAVGVAYFGEMRGEEGPQGGRGPPGPSGLPGPPGPESDPADLQGRSVISIPVSRISKVVSTTLSSPSRISSWSQSPTRSAWSRTSLIFNATCPTFASSSTCSADPYGTDLGHAGLGWLDQAGRTSEATASYSAADRCGVAGGPSQLSPGASTTGPQAAGVARTAPCCVGAPAVRVSRRGLA